VEAIPARHGEQQEVSTTAREVHELLLGRGETVAVAESLTGGLTSAALTATPGASATFRGAVVVYATDLKALLADVPVELLEDRGPVDPQVAAALALGACRRLGASWGLGLTGVAGPDPQDGKPVGTVHIGLAPVGGEPLVRSQRLAGDRDQIRGGAVEAALSMLRDSLRGRE
jgi:nicotinamide-nucleotide amidase